ncbi:MAG: hypothetical protein Q4D87_08930 [Actinomycetaceae bacterium]|nr:hypothetical protein [Actinomycetaceae bacterium]
MTLFSSDWMLSQVFVDYCFDLAGCEAGTVPGGLVHPPERAGRVLDFVG